MERKRIGGDGRAFFSKQASKQASKRINGRMNRRGWEFHCKMRKGENESMNYMVGEFRWRDWGVAEIYRRWMQHCIPRGQLEPTPSE